MFAERKGKGKCCYYNITSPKEHKDEWIKKMGIRRVGREDEYTQNIQTSLKKTHIKETNICPSSGGSPR